jgi:outer membrane protein OmpA-like peptidoglycan-associated protein
MNSRFLLAALLLFTYSLGYGQSQSRSTMDAFRPSRSAKLTASPTPPRAPAPIGADRSVYARPYFGLDLGITSSAYYGGDNFFFPIFSVNDGIYSYARYDDLGSGIGWLLGGKIGFPLSEMIGVEGKLRYQTNYTTGKSSQTFTDASTGETATANNEYTLNLSSGSLLALLHVNLNKSLYIAGGLGFSSLMGNHFTETQKIDPNSTFSYIDQSTGQRTGIQVLSADNSGVDSTFTSSRTDIQLGVGTVIPLGTGSTLLDAEVLVSVPLTKLMQDSYIKDMNDFYGGLYGTPAMTSPSMLYATLTLGLRFPFGGGTNDVAVEDNSNTSSSSNSASTTIDADGKVALTGSVRDAKSGKSIDANMTVVDLTTNQVVATDRTDNDGNYSVKVKAPGSYSVTADADGYLFGTAFFQVDAERRILKNHADIQLSEASTGRTRLLVFFDFNKADLQQNSFPELDRAVRLMKAVPSMQVEIAGYTDSVGTDAYNKDLSQRRANSVRDYLVKNGIQKSRITARGYGEDSPISTNDTEEGRADNRRVEFVVLKK